MCTIIHGVFVSFAFAFAASIPPALVSAQQQPVPAARYYPASTRPVCAPPTPVLPASYPTSNPYRTASVAPVDPRVHHLTEAANHLFAAGLKEEAAKIRRRAIEAKVKTELRAKVAQLKKLQAEVDQLRKKADSLNSDDSEQSSVHAEPKQVLVEVTVAEVNHTKMRKLGADFQMVDFQAITSDGKLAVPADSFKGKRPSSVCVLEKDNQIKGLLNKLRANGLVKILAQPTLITMDGRPASFNHGGEIPIVVSRSAGAPSVEFKRFGTRVDLVPKILEGERLRLELRPHISELDDERSIKVNGVVVPGIRSRCVDTVVELASGQTIVLRGLVRGNKDEETELLVVVKPQILENRSMKRLPVPAKAPPPTPLTAKRKVKQVAK